jgi:hypothetical protein
MSDHETHDDSGFRLASAAPLARPVKRFLFPYHEQTYTELLECASQQSGLYTVTFANANIRDHYLRMLTKALQRNQLDILELAPDTDVVALLNPRLEPFTLDVATHKDGSNETACVLLVREADAIDPHTWSLLFSLMRDLPVLNLACLACWRHDQRAPSEALAAQYREYRGNFCFVAVPGADPATPDNEAFEL